MESCQQVAAYQKPTANALASSRLQAHDADAWVAGLADQRAAMLQMEPMTVVGELQWRLCKLARKPRCAAASCQPRGAP